MDLFTYGFMQRALIAALVVGLAAPAIGTFLVQRRMALMGDGLGHVAVTGVALGLVTGTSPLWTAIGVAVVGAVLIELLRTQGRTSGDVALALLFYGGLAGGVLITGLGGQSAARLQEYLFGAITTLSIGDLWLTMAFAAFIVGACLGLSPQLFALAHDQDFARVAGLRVGVYNVLVAVLAAFTVSVAMRTVGLLLVAALMVVPVATAQQLSRSFRATLLGAMALGTASSVGGLTISAVLSARANVAPGPAIVLLALAFFAATWPIGMLLRRRARLRAPFPGGVEGDLEPHTGHHDHQHGPDCGHVAVPHDDHVDYVHDGHRHAVHGGHYDEH